jgi:hypothetical protein
MVKAVSFYLMRIYTICGLATNLPLILTPTILPRSYKPDQRGKNTGIDHLRPFYAKWGTQANWMAIGTIGVFFFIFGFIAWLPG